MERRPAARGAAAAGRQRARRRGVDLRRQPRQGPDARRLPRTRRSPRAAARPLTLGGPMRSGLAWSWSSALWAAVGVLPGALVVAFVDAPGGLALCVGAIMAGMLGIAPRRSARPRAAFLGIGFAVFLLIGAALARPGWLAVVGIALVPLPASLLAADRPLGRIALMLMVPAVAIGLSFDSASEAAGLALAIVASS